MKKAIEVKPSDKLPQEAEPEQKPPVISFHLSKEQFSENQELDILLVGCTGTGKQGQKDVANQLEVIGQKQKSLFIIHLGDAFYSTGVESADDEKFNRLFYDVYKKSLPFYFVFGNHEYNFQKLEYGFKQSLQSLQGSKATSANREEFIFQHAENAQRESVTNNESKRFNLPRPGYYQIKIYAPNDANNAILSIYCLNTNTLYLDKTQQHWLLNTMREDNAKRIVWAGHHSPQSFGKHGKPSHHDANIYRVEKAANYNALVRDVFESIIKDSGKQPDAIFAAHDHSLQHHQWQPNPSKDPIAVSISGGGGGTETLQDIVRLGEEDATSRSQQTSECKLAIKKCGFTELRLNTNNELSLRYRSDSGEIYAHFSSLSGKPWNQEQPYPELASLAKQSVSLYWRLIRSRKNWDLRNGTEGLNRAGELLMLANKPTLNQNQAETERLKEMEELLKTSKDLRKFFGILTKSNPTYLSALGITNLNNLPPLKEALSNALSSYLNKYSMRTKHTSEAKKLMEQLGSLNDNSEIYSLLTNALEKYNKPSEKPGGLVKRCLAVTVFYPKPDEKQQSSEANFGHNPSRTSILKN